jgi:hypothetical protein
LFYFHFVVAYLEGRKINLSGMSVIEMPVQTTLGVMSIGHNNNDA